MMPQQLISDSKNKGSDVDATLMTSKDILIKMEAVLVDFHSKILELLTTGVDIKKKIEDYNDKLGEYVNYRF